MSGVSPATGPAASPSPGRRDLWLDVGWLLILFAWSAGWCLTASAKLGPTYDEPYYITAGLDHLRSGIPESLATNGVMPLPVDLLALPAYRHEERTGQKINVLDPDQTLAQMPKARRVTLFWLGLLLVSVLRLGRAAGGPWAGRVAAGLVAADPNFLAHSALATTDLPVTAALLAFTRAVYAGRDGGWWRRLLLPGLWYGIAVLCKLSALLYGGLILVVLEVAFRFTSGALARPAGATLGAWFVRLLRAVVLSVLAAAGVILIGVALAVWGFGFPPPGAKPMALIVPKILDNEPLKQRYARLAKEYETQPYAAVAFAFQWWHNSKGRPAFLNGTYYPEGCWFHFPVVLAMKTPLPVMLFGLLALLRPRAAFNALSVTAFVLLLVTLEAKIQTGVRHVLPVMAIGYTAIAVAVCRGLGRVGGWLGLVAVLAMVATSAWVWPHGLGYLNQLFGGPAAAAERVSDSNLDWGQGLPDLAEWHKANGEPPLALWYFGKDTAAHRPPFILIPFELLPIRTTEDFLKTVDRKLIAVGATVMTLHPYHPPEKAIGVRYLQNRKPMTRTATFLIYDLREP